MMMQRFWPFLTARFSLAMIGFAAFAAVLLIAAAVFEISYLWVLAALAVALPKANAAQREENSAPTNCNRCHGRRNRAL